MSSPDIDKDDNTSGDIELTTAGLLRSSRRPRRPLPRRPVPKPGEFERWRSVSTDDLNMFNDDGASGMRWAHETGNGEEVVGHSEASRSGHTGHGARNCDLLGLALKARSRTAISTPCYDERYALRHTIGIEGRRPSCASTALPCRYRRSFRIAALLGRLTRHQLTFPVRRKSGPRERLRTRPTTPSSSTRTSSEQLPCFTNEAKADQQRPYHEGGAHLQAHLPVGSH